MKFLERRTPDSKNESPNSLSLDYTLGLIGFICSFSFNFSVKTGILDETLIYLNIVPIAGMSLMFLILRISSLKIVKESRFLYSGITMQMGWGLAILLIDFFV